tara:strand:- start:470 stop:997 length:528 start_codon:yes stop_codon:yes gene_type:complete
MAFNCSIALRGIGINCSKRVTGGIKKVILLLQNDIQVVRSVTEPTLLLQVYTANPRYFTHNIKDGVTSFDENKDISNGLGVVNTDIIVQIPSIDNKINKIDYMSRREDIVAILLHNNDSVTISGFKDGLTMNYEANSGASISDKSFVNVRLSTTSGSASEFLDDKSAFFDQTIFD